ncbi:MAG TPA: hypothetical protein ENG02_01320 [Candidatus Woesearchaeota archaeon]|nr:hypothetical protein [Candidatus Woesearchaeota archaeon]
MIYSKEYMEKAKRFPLYDLLLAYEIYKRTARALNKDINSELTSPITLLEAYQRKDTKELSEILQKVRKIKREDEIQKVALEAFFELASYIGTSPKNLKEIEEKAIDYLALRIEDECKERKCIEGLKEILKLLKESEEEESITDLLDRWGVQYNIIGKRRLSKRKTKKRFFGLLKKAKEKIENYVRFVAENHFNSINPNMIKSKAAKGALEILISLGVLARVEGTDGYAIAKAERCKIKERTLYVQNLLYEAIEIWNEKPNLLEKAINRLYAKLVMSDYREHQRL